VEPAQQVFPYKNSVEPEQKERKKKEGEKRKKKIIQDLSKWARSGQDGNIFLIKTGHNQKQLKLGHQLRPVVQLRGVA